MSAVDDFLLALCAEAARLSVSRNPRDADRMRAIEVLAASYETDAKASKDARRTLEREAWLRVNYASWPGLKEDVLAALNALPGAPVTAHEMSNWAYAMNLKRGREALAFARRRKAIPKGRDGSFSMAEAAEGDLLDGMGECPATLADALEWGRRNGMRPSGSLAEDLRATNTLRAGHGLPGFTPIADKPAQGPLPRLLTHQAG